VQILDDGTPTQIEQILARGAIARAIPLPVSDVRERVFDADARAQGRSPLPAALFDAQFSQ
jgi:hypothetical protein